MQSRWLNHFNLPIIRRYRAILWRWTRSELSNFIFGKFLSMRLSFRFIFLSFYLKFVLTFLTVFFNRSICFSILDLFGEFRHFFYLFYRNFIFWIWARGKSLFFFQKLLSLYFSSIAFSKIYSSLFFELNIRFRGFLSEIKLLIFLHLRIYWE
jgi:hypothetical protein